MHVAQHEGDCESQSQLAEKFSMKDLDPVKKIHRMRIKRERREVS